MKGKYSNIKKIILNNWPEAKIIYINEFSEGYNNVAYDVKLDIGEFVVKIIRLKGYEKYLLKQKKIRTLIQKKFKDFPIAKIIKSDYSKKVVSDFYIISEKVPGISLQEGYLKVKNREELYEEIGELYGKFHSLKLESYGELDHNLRIIKEYKSWYSLKIKEIKKILKKIEESKLLSEKTIKECVDYFEKNKSLLKKELGPRLCHGDAADSNIIIEKVGEKFHVSGLIDFEFARSSGATYEFFSGLRSFERKYKHRESLIKGYTKWGKLPKDWENLVFFYQWMERLKQLTRIKGMKWRNLSDTDTKKRKKDLRKKSLSEIKKIIKK